MFSIAVEIVNGRIGRRIRMFAVKSSVGSNVRTQASRLVEHSVTLMEYMYNKNSLFNHAAVYTSLRVI